MYTIIIIKIKKKKTIIKVSLYGLKAHTSSVLSVNYSHLYNRYYG
jgi:hypothetical protein